MRAVNDAGTSSNSDVASATTLAPPPPEPPAAPANLAATALSQVAIDLQWSDLSDDETGFELERRIEAGVWSSPILLPVNSNSFTDTGLQAATLYEYRVRAVNDAGASADSDVASATTLAPPPEPLTISVGAINISVTGGKRFRQAAAAVTILDSKGVAVSGITVTGDWQVDTQPVEGASALTGADGVALIGSGKLVADGSTVWEFCVSGVSGGATYEPLDNVAICGRSGGDEPAPTGLLANFDVVCSSQDCQFTDRSTSTLEIVQWNWKFGDGQTSTAANPFHRYATTGRYDVSLEVTDSDGATATATQRVQSKR